MKIPDIPTDNLYKFLALTGLLFVFVSIALYEYRRHTHNLEDAKIRVGIEELAYTSENYFKRAQYLSEQLNSELEKEVPSIDKLQLLKKEVDAEMLKIANPQIIADKSMELRLMSELADSSVAATDHLKVWLLFSGIAGLFMTVSGFILWYFKLQRYQDEKLKNEALKN